MNIINMWWFLWDCLLKVNYSACWEYNAMSCNWCELNWNHRGAVWRSYIEHKEVHTVRTFCTKDPKGTKGEECWRSVGRFWRPTRKWHKLTHIYKYVVKYCPGVVSLWDVGLRDNPARCAVLINKFQYFDFWSLLLFLNTQDNLKSNNITYYIGYINY